MSPLDSTGLQWTEWTEWTPADSSGLPHYDVGRFGWESIWSPVESIWNTGGQTRPPQFHFSTSSIFPLLYSSTSIRFSSVPNTAISIMTRYQQSNPCQSFCSGLIELLKYATALGMNSWSSLLAVARVIASWNKQTLRLVSFKTAPNNLAQDIICNKCF